ncbi:MAG: hypothetical protein H6907_10835 [Hyphomicrobiales bacterium]|nr:hypothetical protein [Hyphomicrobiales bacterium]MCP5372214.1 hypothetical protein [Hyphomicrobiales bacterium]
MSDTPPGIGRPDLLPWLDSWAAAPAPRRVRAVLVAAAALVLVLAAPDSWRMTPDSGILIGSAVELVDNARYWFNGHPNLLYFPGVPVLLVPVVFLFGLDFGAIQVLAAAVGAGSLVLAHRCYDPGRFGLPGLVLPLLLAVNALFLAAAFTVSSAGVLLAAVLAAFAAWRRYLRDRAAPFLALTALLAAYAPLVRYEGLCLSAAFALAYLMAQWRRAGPAAALARAVPLGLAVVAPFVLWAARNYVDYTPETFNMLNKMFFGQPSALLYAPGSVRLGWDLADWQWPLLRLAYFLDGFVDGLVGARLGDLVPPAVTIPALAVLAALGVPRWYRGAHALEVAFALLMLLFLVAWNLRPGSSLVVVPRYWVPLLPVALVLLAGGVLRLVEALRRPGPRLAGAALGLLAGAVLAANGVASLAYYLRSDADYAAGLAAMRAAAGQVRTRTAADAVVAVTDWGAMPLLLHRPTVLALNDPDHERTLRLLLRKDARALVVVDGLASLTSQTSRRMVRDHPDVFPELFRQGAPGGLFTTTVHGIDPDRLRAAVARMPTP